MKSRNRSLSLTLALGLAATVLGAGAPAARASLVAVLIDPASGGSASVFTYNLLFSSNGGSEQLADGGILTLYDFAVGMTDANVVVSSLDFTVTVGDLGEMPIPSSGSINPIDSASISNITFVYSGPDLLDDATFVVTITLNGPHTTRRGQYASQNAFPAAPGGTNTQIGDVFLPTAAVPEPSSLFMVGVAGAAALGGVARRRFANRVG